MKILVCDDHALIREAMRGVLKELVSDAWVIEASDGRRAMELIAEDPQPDLMLLDLSLPDQDGLAMLGDLHKRHPAISTVVLRERRERGVDLLSIVHDRYDRLE